MKHAAVIAVSFVILGGCASQPVPVKEFASDAEFKAFAGQNLPFGKLDTFEDVQAAMLAYHNLYSKERTDKLALAQTANETGFYSSIVGVLGGIAKSVETAAAGAVGAAGAGLYNDRYKLAIQASNYGLGADALLCMYQKSPGGTSSSLKAFRLSGSKKSADTDVRDIARDGLFAVRRKTRSLQESLELGTPDPNKLKQALEQKPEKSEKDNNAVAALSNDERKALEMVNTEALETYRKEIKACEALMGA